MRATFLYVTPLGCPDEAAGQGGEAKGATRRGWNTDGLHALGASSALLPFLPGHQDVPRLRAHAGPDDPAVLHEVHETPGPGEPRP